MWSRCLSQSCSQSSWAPNTNRGRKGWGTELGNRPAIPQGNLPEIPRPIHLLCPHSAFRTLQESQEATRLQTIGRDSMARNSADQLQSTLLCIRFLPYEGQRLSLEIFITDIHTPRTNGAISENLHLSIHITLASLITLAILKHALKPMFLKCRNITENELSKCLKNYRYAVHLKLI